MNDNGSRLIHAAAQQQAMQAQTEAMLMAELRATCREIYSGLAKEYLAGTPQPNAKALRELADLAWKAAQYVYSAPGVVKPDDEKIWGKPPSTIQ